MAMLSLPTLAGFVSTVIFAASALPMLVKACRSRDLASYSLGNIALANLGNAVYSVYVYSLPPGPIWLLHTFYLVSSALMLGWYLRYGLRQPRSGRVPTAAGFRGAGGHVASPGPKVGSRLRGRQRSSWVPVGRAWEHGEACRPCSDSMVSPRRAGTAHPSRSRGLDAPRAGTHSRHAPANRFLGSPVVASRTRENRGSPNGG